MEPSGEVAAAQRLYSRVERESMMKDPLDTSSIILTGRKGCDQSSGRDYFSEGIGLAERKAWTLLTTNSTTNSHWGSFDMVMRTRRRLDF